MLRAQKSDSGDEALPGARGPGGHNQNVERPGREPARRGQVHPLRNRRTVRPLRRAPPGGEGLRKTTPTP